MIPYIVAFLVGFLVFVGICLSCFYLYSWSDQYLKKKGINNIVKDVITYTLSFCLAFGFAFLTAPLMGYGKNPILTYFGK